MKKNIRDYKKVGVQYAYILDAINNSENENATDKENINYFFKVFSDEYDNPYSRKCYPVLQTRIAQYIQGLPSCIDIAFTDYDIINIGKSWGCCKTGKNEDTFIYNWFNLCAQRLIELKDILNK